MAFAFTFRSVMSAMIALVLSCALGQTLVVGPQSFEMIESITLSPFWLGLFCGAIGLFLVSFVLIWRLSVRHARAQQRTRANLDEQLQQAQELKSNLAIARQQVLGLEEFNQRLERELAERTQFVAALQGEVMNLKTSLAELNTQINQERLRASEKIQAIQNAEQQMIRQFEALGAKILDEKSKTFSEQSQINLDRLLSPLREQLGEFRKKVDDVHVEDSKDRAALREAIRNLNLENQRIGQEANNLARALKGDKKAQGTWGELILEKVLEQSGLRKGIEYEAQGAFRDSEHRLLKPDVIVRLPEGRDIVIDSKVSLLAYERYASAESEEHRNQARAEHIQALRAHIKGLSDKHYASVRGIRSLDFVLLFMPIESAFMLAFEQDDSLFSEAFRHNIIVVTPTTLLATLRTIENIWRYERRNENARIIAEKAALLYDKVRGFVEDFEKLGNQIATLHGTYDGALNKLSQGKGNLLRQTASFVDLGVKVKKAIPRSIMDQAIDEDFQIDDVQEKLE